MKIVVKTLLVMLITIIGLFSLYILTLQIFEYRPEEVMVLEIIDNPEAENANLVPLASAITILSFNIGYASLSATEDFAMDGGTKGRMDSRAEVEANLAGIATILTNAEADIYLLQEVDDGSARSYRTLQQDYFHEHLGVSSTLGYNYRCLFVPFPFNPSQMMGQVRSGIGSFIPYHVESAIRYQLPGSFSWPISLANLKRCIVVSRLPIADSDKYLVIVNVHLSAYDDGSMRLAEMEKLKEIILEEADNGNYVIVGGDFNQTFPAAVTSAAEADPEYLYPLRDPSFWEAFPMESAWFLENGFVFAVDVATPTCRLLHQPYDSDNPENNQYYVIDGFIVSANVEIIGVETLAEGFLHSDHNPVRLTIRLVP
mgnify:CR=1 FL=1